MCCQTRAGCGSRERRLIRTHEYLFIIYLIAYLTTLSVTQTI
jgi:hypothetical protein